MTDVHALSGAYAVDALDDLERARFERHLDECADCRAEVESLREASALLSTTTTLEPSAELRERVLASIATVRPLPPVVAEMGERAERRRRRFPALVAAAAAVAVIGVGGALTQPWNDEPAAPTAGPTLSASEAVLQAPDAVRSEQALDDGGSVSVVRSDELNQAVLVSDSLPELSDDYAFALWLDHDGVLVPAGVINAGDDASAVMFSGDVATADGAGITVERVGDDDGVPSNARVAMFAFERT